MGGEGAGSEIKIFQLIYLYIILIFELYANKSSEKIKPKTC